jgi:predicted alpha-1,2-mannosidase
MTVSLEPLSSFFAHPTRPLKLFAWLACLMGGSLLSLPCHAGSKSPVEEALPLVGTGGHGHTYPGATAPFGFVQLSPDTRTQGWDACSGYHYSDTNILGFSHTHLSGTGIADLADLLVTPMTGPLNGPEAYTPLRAERFKSAFSHDNEVAQPGYYRVQLDTYHVLAELTATPHAGMHRYTFPASTESRLLLDLVHGTGNNPLEAALRVEGSNTLTGYRRSSGWAKNKTVYFTIECSQPFTSFGLEQNGAALATDQSEAKGRNVRAHLDFSTVANQPVLLRVGLSPVSVEGARKNLRGEISSWDFDAVRKAAQNDWNAQLSRIRIEAPDPVIRQTFYSALYHTMIAPTLYNDADGTYFGPDRQVHAADFQFYSTFSLWDTYRAEHPLLTLIQPARVNDFVRSMLAFSQQSPGQSLPMWPLANYETWCMIGYHSMPVILDAYNKGFRGYDADAVFQAMRATAMNGRLRQDEYQKYGFVPLVKGKVESASRTLEFSYDDWCIAQMARALGKTEDTEPFTRRSQNYTNAWDPKTRFFRTKNPDGSFPKAFDPKDIGNEEYTEGNAWQFGFSAVQDVPGMIALYGGRKAFVERLDELFNQDSDMVRWRSDITGIIGQYAHGNEPCHHIAYLYALAGAQYKTAQRVRNLMLTQYDNTPEGSCGNDDCGQMSAWYVFSAIGLYPVNPANGVYVIGSPNVDKATIELDPRHYKGGTFTIVAHKNSKLNYYVQSAKLNGKSLDRPWITHEEIVNGGTLDLEMGVLPNKAWPPNHE